jgi:corrinoid protein of di/trimethylamine methyltransferase
MWAKVWFTDLSKEDRRFKIRGHFHFNNCIRRIAVGVLENVYNAVLDGKVEDAEAGVEQGLKEGIAVDDILKKGLLSAMDVVGERFGRGEMFIPQVIWSAKSMQAGMDLLRPHFAEGQQEKSARIVIGTAEGDIHDIGKNLVGMMLEGAGFEVVDLGVGINPEQFIEKAAEEKADIIGVSALLTTTMMCMADVVKLRNEKGLSSLKVIIGGAPLSQDFCNEIGADAYGVDAMDAVVKVKELMGL